MNSNDQANTAPQDSPQDSRAGLEPLTLEQVEQLDCYDSASRLEQLAQHLSEARGLAFTATNTTPADDSIYSAVQAHCTLGVKGLPEPLRADYSAGVGIVASWAAKNTRAALRGASYSVGHSSAALLSACKRMLQIHRVGFTTDELSAFKCARSNYVPTCADLLSMLLMDDVCIDGHCDWLSWANELGMVGAGSSNDAQALRKLSADFEIIRARAHSLRTILGPHFTEARQLAQQL